MVEGPDRRIRLPLGKAWILSVPETWQPARSPKRFGRQLPGTDRRSHLSHPVSVDEDLQEGDRSTGKGCRSKTDPSIRNVRGMPLWSGQRERGFRPWLPMRGWTIVVRATSVPPVSADSGA